MNQISSFLILSKKKYIYSQLKIFENPKFEERDIFKIDMSNLSAKS